MGRHTGRRRATVLLAVAPALLVGVLAGCSAESGSDAASDSGGMSQEAPQLADEAGGGAADGAAGSESAEGGASGSAADTTTDRRKVITTGDVSMTSDDPRAAADDVVQLVERVEGRVDERYERAATTGQDAGAELVVRVPSDDLTPTLDELEQIGDVVQVQLSAEDVTARTVDLDARIRSLQLSVARMEDLLSRATTSEDLITAEQALSDRQTQLETLQSQKAGLAEQVALSTLRISIALPPEEPVEVAPEPEVDSFLDGLVAGWRSLVAMLSGLVVVLGVLLPWLVLGGLVTFGVVRLTRWVRARRPQPEPHRYTPGPWVGVPVNVGAPASAPVAEAPSATQPAPDPTPNPPQER